MLRETGGNQLRAAALLGINRNTLRKKLRQLGLRRRLPRPLAEGLREPLRLDLPGGRRGHGRSGTSRACCAVQWLGARFPYGTLAVNLSGAFLIGLLQQLAGGLIPEGVRLFLVVGVLGGMTTYSAFAYETVRLMTLAEWGKAWTNLTVTTGLCLGLCWLGMATGRIVTGPSN